MATKIQAMTSNIVIAEQTPLILSLSNAFPIWIAAKVKPAFGKMKAHQFSVNVICLAPAKTPTSDRAKNQNATSQRNMPAIAPMTLIAAPTSKSGKLKKLEGITDVAWFPKATSAADVYPAGPTEMNMPGRVEGAGSVFDMSLAR